MNFGNPQRPRSWASSSAPSKAWREACLALDFPVVSGNVSLYNEDRRQAARSCPRPPSAASACCPMRRRRRRWPSESRPGDPADRRDPRPSRPVAVAARIAGREDGPPPPVDLARSNGQWRCRARADPAGKGRRARLCRWRAAGRAGGNGDGGGVGARWPLPPGHAPQIGGSARTRPAMSWRCPPMARPNAGDCRPRRPARRSPSSA
jgi:hypothetical protein